MSINERQAQQLTDINRSYQPHWFRLHMPYLIERLDEKGKLWLPLNRDYKPLGMPRSSYVKYTDFTDRAMLFARDPRLLKGIFVDTNYPGPDKGEDRLVAQRMWLYRDDTRSRLDYFARLEKLLSYDVRTTKAEVHRAEYQALPAEQRAPL